MSTSRRAAWAVPVAAAVLVGGLAVFPSLADAQAPNLPPLTPEQLVAKVVEALPVAFSGTVSVSSNLGLPDLSSFGSIVGLQPADITNLLTGKTRVQVAFDPAVGARAEIDATESSYVTIANVANRDGWIYSSSANTATHITVAAGAAKPSPAPTGELPTPAAIAQRLVDGLTPTTHLSVATTARVAGRDAYTLVLTPADGGSLIASVDLAVDAETWTPLRAQVWSTQLPGTPALDVAFTSISYATPDPSLFTFAPPAGVKVTTMDNPGDIAPASPKPSTDHPAAEKPAVAVVAGAGWATVVKIPAGASGSSPLPLPSTSGKQPSKHRMGGQANVSDLLGALAQQVPEGTLYSTYLVTALVTPAGDVYAGAVPGATLQAAARAAK